jgi:hypothetical protein
MKYDIMFKSKDPHQMQSVCFGSLGSTVSSYITNRTVTKDDFLGVRVHIGYNQGHTEETPRTPEQRQWLIERHNEVMGRWTDGIIQFETSGSSKVPMYAFYPTDCPVYLFMASASFWRLHDNFGYYRAVWESLEPHKTFQELSSLLKHFCVFGIAQGSSSANGRISRMPLPNSKVMDKEVLLVASNSGHAPFKNSLVNVNNMAHMHLIDQKYILDNVPAFWDQLQTTNTISYQGRDDWWAAPNKFNPKFRRITEHMIEGLRDVYPDIQTRVPKSEDPYTFRNITTPRKYLAAFSQLNHEVQKIVSDWT